MRFIILNPHKSEFFGITLLNYISKIFSASKYKFLIKYLASHQNKLYIYLTPLSSSLPSYISPYIPIKLELFLWAIINKINPFKIHIISDIRKLNKSDVLFSLTIRTFDNTTHPYLPPDHKFYEIFHITHFSHFTSVLANNLSKLKPNLLVAENNLYSNSKYFQKYFTFYKKNVYHLPYTFESRFKKLNSFNSRINKCLATGSLAITKELGNKAQFADFESFYHVDSLYPLRKTIFENKHKIRRYVDSYISKVFDHKPKMPDKNDSIFIKLYKSIYNGISISKHKYYKFDIVQKYNQYKMFVVPEEINDLPGIGFVEGMACGCAYLGKVDPMFTDLGLKPGYHYIGYNGTLSDLTSKISYYQKHPSELANIAKNGYKFVTSHFNNAKVAKIFLSDIKQFTNNRKSKKASTFTQTPNI